MKSIKLRGHNPNNLEMVVDDEDFEFMSQFRWYLNGRGDYAYCRLNAHRMIIKAKDWEIVDHINGNPLDNRKSNLRIVTQAQNQQNKRIQKRNSTGYKGVSKSPHNKRKQKFRVFIQNKSLGTYDTAEEAARVYDREAKIRFGEYARLNFPEEQ